VINDRERANIQKELIATPRPSVEYALAMRRHGTEQVKFFRRIYAHLAARETPEIPLFRTFYQLLLTYSPTQPIRSFETGSAALRALLEATKASDRESHPILSGYATTRLENATDFNQRHTSVLALVESDVDAALDVLLSPSLAGDIYVSHADSSRRAELTRLVTSAMGFYRLIQGLAVNRAMFTSSGGLIGYAHGGLRRGDLVVKFQGAAVAHVLRACGDEDDRYQLCSPAVVKASCELEELVEDTGWREFVLV
jgi:hypothetical protein